MLLLAFHGIGRVGHGTFRYGIGEDALLFLGIVDTKGGLDVEAFERVDVQESVTKHSPVGVTVVGVAFEAGEGVLAVGVAAYRTGELTVGGVNGDGRVELEHVLQESAGSLHFGGAVHGEVFADGHNVTVANFQELVVRVDTGAQTGEVGVFDNTVVLIVTQGEEGVSAFGTVAQREVVLLDDTGAGGFLEPVGVAGGRFAGGIQVFVHFHAVQGRIAADIVAPVVHITQGVHVGVQAVIHIALPHHTAEFLGVEHLHAVHVGLCSDAGVEVHFYLAVLAPLGGDDDHTVGGAATVNGSGGGVFQHLDALNIVTVEFMHAGLGWYTVDDVQRVVVVQGADTTDAHGGCTGRGTVGRDVHARDTSLEGFHGVVLVLLGQVFRIHGGDGAGEVGLALNGITGDHHFIQKLGVFIHHHRHLRLGGEFQRGVTDRGEDQDGSFFHREGEVAVKVRCCTVGGTLFHDCGANDTVAVGRRGYHTGNRNLLGEGGKAGQQEDRK